MKAVEATFGAGSALRVLSEPLRLRILSLLEAEELSVGELSRCLGVSQSRVSNHLRVLREAELLAERHVGTSTFLRMARPTNGAAIAGRLWDVLREEMEALPDHGADQVRLESVLAERSGGDSFFDRAAGEWDKIAGAFETGLARERAAGHLLPARFEVADLGCGTGYMGAALLGRASRLISVDFSDPMLAEAKKRLLKNPRGTELEFRQGTLDHLPLEDAEVDGVLAGMVLHHMEAPDRALEEMFRILRPGGSVSVLELAPHGESWMRQELNDLHLGLEPGDVLAAFERAGFEDLVLDPVEDRYQPSRADESAGEGVPSLTLYLVRGRKPLA